MSERCIDLEYWKRQKQIRKASAIKRKFLYALTDGITLEEMISVDRQLRVSAEQVLMYRRLTEEDL